MIQRPGFAAFLLCAAGIAPLYGGKPAPCQDIPIQWTLNDYYVGGTPLNAIRDDGAGPYRNGLSGVTATIKNCESTHDAVLMTGSSRQLTFTFAAHMLTTPNSNTPSWAYQIVTGSGGVLNVRNITYAYDSAHEYTFTTWAGSDVPVKGSWNFRMWNPTTDAISGDPATNPYVATANTPNINTLVNAYHCPAAANNPTPSATCTGVTLETWFVWPQGSGPWVGGLVNTTKPTNPVSAGQFSMPFYYVISVLP